MSYSFTPQEYSAFQLYWASAYPDEPALSKTTMEKLAYVFIHVLHYEPDILNDDSESEDFEPSEEDVDEIIENPNIILDEVALRQHVSTPRYVLDPMMGSDSEDSEWDSDHGIWNGYDEDRDIPSDTPSDN